MRFFYHFEVFERNVSKVILRLPYFIIIFGNISFLTNHNCKNMSETFDAAAFVTIFDVPAGCLWFKLTVLNVLPHIGKSDKYLIGKRHFVLSPQDSHRQTRVHRENMVATHC